MTSANWNDPAHTRSDARLAARAARSGWNVPQPVKRDIVNALAQQIDHADARALAAIAGALVAMDRADTAADRLELDRERTEQPTEQTIRIVYED
jgi:hypothetical protein